MTSSAENTIRDKNEKEISLTLQRLKLLFAVNEWLKEDRKKKNVIERLLMNY